MKDIRIFVTLIAAAVAFFVGRLSVDQIGAREMTAAVPLAAEDSIAPTNLTPSKDTPAISVNPSVSKTKLDSKAAGACLAQISRRDLLARTSELEAELIKFQEIDLRFPSRAKMSTSDWKRVSDSGDLTGVVQFKIGSVLSSKIKVQFKDRQMAFEIHYRKSSAKSADDFVTTSTSFPLINGLGAGVSQDGANFHVVIPNPISEPVWDDYSLFAFPIPFDWNGRAEVDADVFGLNEQQKWENVGQAKLTLSR